MKNSLCKAGVVSVLILLAISPAVALTLTVGFSPGAQIVNRGDSIAVDVFALHGPGEIVSAFDLDLSYDSTFLRTTSVSFATSLGDPDQLQAITASDFATPGLTNFSDLSLLSDADLSALQATSSFTLATITFTAIAAGTSPLEFINYGVGGKDIKGANDVVYSPVLDTGTITVTGTSAVPEPSAIVFLSIGVCCLAISIRRSHRARKRAASQN